VVGDGDGAVVVTRVGDFGRFVVEAAVGSDADKIVGQDALDRGGIGFRSGLRPLGLALLDVAFRFQLFRILRLTCEHGQKRIIAANSIPCLRMKFSLADMSRIRVCYGMKVR